MSTERCEPLTLAGLPLPVDLRIHPRARTLRLTVDERRGVIRLTCPPRTSWQRALEWARQQSDWIETRLAALEPVRTLAPGNCIPIDGVDHRLHWMEGEARTVRQESGQLISGGPREGFERRIARWVKAEALRRLSAETAALAATESLSVAGVAVGDAGTRWGSCSASGRIRYNLRLLFAPVEVRRFVVAHELAHRRHMDHGPAFHRLEAELFGGPVAEARLALRRIGPGLKRIDLPL